ncbi:putative Cdc6 [Operophtera brumata]|uniref:Putative Cdc6 n=1 Tax=Operophtera brumata TaxID=104452 RepID=A0A0L7LFJ0_OPEBR|nr:putative Cdc6 [Operophtera brumata]
MVTSNKVPDKKVVKMVDQNSSVVVPQRTLLGEVNEHITCPLCRGYYIDATTIVECLHSFCRSCIIKHLNVKSYCPVCEMMINSAKPNIKLDKALQDIVYKLVPGLFQKEMERRQTFYSSRPGPAASATPEQRGEDTERIIFSPEDVISFSLEYADATDSDSISSKSSDSNEPPSTAGARRYLQCPAVVNISHLKKFLSMKFDIDSTQYAIDILYKRVPLPDYYTLMDIAYIYNWKRNEPMRFFYQIIDYIAIRNRILEINRQCSKFTENKSSPASTEDTSNSSPAPQINDQTSEPSSGTNSPLLDENSMKQADNKKNEKYEQSRETFEKLSADRSSSFPKKNEEDVEKSQFLNSFELAPKGTCVTKTSPTKATTSEAVPSSDSATTTMPSASKTQESTTKPENKTKDNSPKHENKLPEPQKRKQQTPANTLEMKRLKIELEKTKINQILDNYASSAALANPPLSSQNNKVSEPASKPKEVESPKNMQGTSSTNNAAKSQPSKEVKAQPISAAQQQLMDIPGIKRNVTAPHSVPTSKRKPIPHDPTQSPMQQTPQAKTISPLKIQLPKSESKVSNTKTSDAQKPHIKKMPDLKPGVPPTSHSLQNKAPAINKVRMDLLANNSDPTMDRTKILSQVKSSLTGPKTPSPGPASGDPLKSLFDSCKINIPSSLSITLFDQKVDPRNAGETGADQKNNLGNKTLPGASSNQNHKVHGPSVPNYIEIMKLPDTDTNKKPSKGDVPENKTNLQNKTDATTGQVKQPTKSSETSSAKGPVPNLKPIADTKLGKQATTTTTTTTTANFIGPITFQQTFEQQLQALQGDKKSKTSKNKSQVPKLVPATPKSLNAANKPSTFINIPNTSGDNKTSTALDLSSPNNSTGTSGPQQTFDKAFEAMQSIANLAKKQTLPSKGTPPTMSQSSSFPSMSNRPMPAGITPLRIPSTSNISQIKLDKVIPTASQMNIARQETINKSNLMKQANNPSPSTTSAGYQMSPSHASPSAQPSPRQTRSPSSSPKLVIAEEKQVSNIPHEQSKLPGRQPITPMLRPSAPNMPNAPDYFRPSQFMSQQAIMRHQMEMSAAWMKAQRQYDFDMAAVQATIPFKSHTCTAVKIARLQSTVETEEKTENENSAKPLTSREKEIEWLEEFLMQHIESEESASLYVSGHPGTGKTASLSYILQMTKLSTSATTEKASCSAIEKYLNKKHKMILLVLDEIDQLDSKRQSVLYTIFEWPALPSSRLVLVGVANALDLTERTLPRLQARCSLRPATLHFAPYSKEQIINIFTAVLASEDRNHVARRGRFAEHRSVEALASHPALTVELKEVLQVLSDVYGGSRQMEADVGDGLPMQQKLILVAAARNIEPLNMSEMSGACALLESRGALRVAGAAAAGRGRRVRLQWDESELNAALRDKPLLSAILNDVNCLS